MITDRGKVIIDNGVEYLADWQDYKGNYKFDQYLSNGRLIVNKMTTGCGFTTYCLCNMEHTILVSPRVPLLRNKLEQFNKNNQQICYYYNREKNNKGKQMKEFSDLENEFTIYLQSCQFEHRPMKLLVTYDSFANLAEMLENKFGLDVNLFRIAIDEAHCLIKDVPMKEYVNKCVLTDFLSRVFKYEKLLFISATPIVKYISEIEEFKKYPVDYIELAWPNIMQVITRSQPCKSAIDAFDQIYKKYSKNTDSIGNHFFDVIYDATAPYYSYEAVIFINSVGDIRKILNKYAVKGKLIDLADVSVICARTKENIEELRRKVSKEVNVLESIPKRGDRHSTWTFVTRTAFEGVDFYSECASSYVIANYNVKSLCIDIASDIPQIVGRQRVKTNPFRSILHIFFINNERVLSDSAFAAMKKEKMEQSQLQIELWQSAPEKCKEVAIKGINAIIDNEPCSIYVKTVNGFPEINNMLIISEEYSRDILKNHTQWFIMSSTAVCQNLYSIPVQQLKDELTQTFCVKPTMERVRIALEYFTNYSQFGAEFLQMLHNEGYTDIARYFGCLTLERIHACGCDTWKMDAEIQANQVINRIVPIVSASFEKGKVYSKAECKAILQYIYDKNGIKKTAKAVDIQNFIGCAITKKDGLKAYRIL